MDRFRLFPSGELGLHPTGEWTSYADAQRALNWEREKVRRLSTCGTDHSTPWWQVKCEDLEAQLATLQARNKELDRTLADVYQQRDGLQAQLRQMEGAKPDVGRLAVWEGIYENFYAVDSIVTRDAFSQLLAFYKAATLDAQDAGKGVGKA